MFMFLIFIFIFAGFDMNYGHCVFAVEKVINLEAIILSNSTSIWMINF